MAGESGTVTKPSAAAKGPRSPRNASEPCPGRKNLTLNPFVHGPPLQNTVADESEPSAVAPWARSMIVAGAVV